MMPRNVEDERFRWVVDLHTRHGRPLVSGPGVVALELRSDLRSRGSVQPLAAIVLGRESTHRGQVRDDREHLFGSGLDVNGIGIAHEGEGYRNWWAPTSVCLECGNGRVVEVDGPVFGINGFT